MGVVIVAMLASGVLALVILALYWYVDGQCASPDGMVYIAAGRGESVPRPFHLRPLVPSICRTNLIAWKAASVVGLVLAAVTCAGLVLAYGGSSVQAIGAAGLLVGLPIVRSTALYPVLVDGPALGLCGLSALLAIHDQAALSALVAFVGAMSKEHVPVFAALAAWSPWPLIGCVATAILALSVKPSASNHPSQSDPLRYAHAKQSSRLLTLSLMVAPWGLGLFAVIGATASVSASLALSYGLLFVSADSTRIYQWAALAVCPVAAMAIPDAWMAPAVALHVLNPWRGDL